MKSKNPSNEDIILAKTILFRYNFGVLSTISQHDNVPGYPFGSVCPYVLDESNQVVIYISKNAEHTKNILVNPRVSFTIVEDVDAKNVQAKSRLTYIGDAIKTPEEKNEELRTLYLKKLPHQKILFRPELLDEFHFYQIELKLIRFIVSYTQASWIKKEDFEKVLEY